MEEKDTLSRAEILEKMIAKAQSEPGIIDLMSLYGKLDDLLLKSKEYLNIYKPVVISSLSNRSS